MFKLLNLLISFFKVKFPSGRFARLSPFISTADLLVFLKARSCLIWIWSAPWFPFSWYSLLLWLWQVELWTLEKLIFILGFQNVFHGTVELWVTLLFLIFVFLLIFVLSSGMAHFRFLEASDHVWSFRATKALSL